MKDRNPKSYLPRFQSPSQVFGATPSQQALAWADRLGHFLQAGQGEKVQEVPADNLHFDRGHWGRADLTASLGGSGGKRPHRHAEVAWRSGTFER